MNGKKNKANMKKAQNIEKGHLAITTCNQFVIRTRSFCDQNSTCCDQNTNNLK